MILSNKEVNRPENVHDFTARPRGRARKVPRWTQRSLLKLEKQKNENTKRKTAGDVRLLKLFIHEMENGPDCENEDPEE